jgi:hypothetical protein
MAADVMTARTEDRPNREQLTVRRYPVAIAVLGLWLAVATISIFAPGMITGSEQEHLPIAAITTWFWGAIATGFVVFTVAFPTDEAKARWGLTIAVLSIWGAVTLASIFAPTMVTGGDPTTIPIVAILAPMAGVLATAFVCLAAAWSVVSGRRL